MKGKKLIVGVLTAVLVTALSGFIIFVIQNSRPAGQAEVQPVEPIAEYTFEMVNGSEIENTGSNSAIGTAQIIGAGNIAVDEERGNVFYSYGDDQNSSTVRKNYLQLDGNTFKNGITGEAFSVTMWMKFDAEQVDITGAYQWADIFVAYDSTNREKYPMTKLGVNLIGRMSNTEYDRNAYFDTSDMGNYLADSQWHHIAFTVSTERTKIYVDGKEVSGITFDGTRGRTVGNFFFRGKSEIDTVSIGGNSLWNDDPDMCAMYDDIRIYDVELSAEQISLATGYIANGVSFNEPAIAAGREVKFTIDTSLINKKDVVAYEWYVGDELVSTSSEAYTPTEENIENTLTLKVTMKDGSYTQCSAYYSVFPVLYLDSETSYAGVDSQYATVNFNLTGEDYSEEQLYNGAAEIKLRGNSTAGLAKRPFKVKLETKADLLGYGESKHWVLLANAIDVSLVRNKLLQGLAGDLGLDCMESELVNLVYNGQYYGVYELSEHVRVGTSRVDIFDWEELAEDIAKLIAKTLKAAGEISKEQYEAAKDALEDELVADFSWVDSETHEFTSDYLREICDTYIFKLTDYMDFENDVPAATGGVLLEMDFWYQIQQGKEPNVLTAYALPIYTNTPDAEAKFDSLVEYIDTYVQAMEYSLHTTDFVYDNHDIHYKVADKGWYDGTKRVGVTYRENEFDAAGYDGWHYTDFLDIDSAINNMLVCEISLNWDCMKNSFFMYKDIDGKMVFGPVWDFDWAWGNSMGQNTNAPQTWQTTNEWFANEQYYQTVQWNRLLIRDPYFVVKLYERYHDVRDEYIATILGDALYEMWEKNSLPGYANELRWGGAFSATAGQTYEEQLEYIQTFLMARIMWLDEQFSSIDALNASLGYYVTSDDIQFETCDTSGESGYTIVTAKIDNEAIKQVSFQVNGTNFYSAKVSDGVATVKVPDDALETDGSLNVVQARGMDAAGEYIANPEGTIEGNYTNAISNYCTFTK